MKTLPQCLNILAILSFCIPQMPSSGFPLPSADPPDYYAVEGIQDINKRFLFHYSRTQEPTYPLQTLLAPVHPLVRLAAKLAHRRVRRFVTASMSWCLSVSPRVPALKRSRNCCCMDFTKKGIKCFLLPVSNPNIFLESCDLHDAVTLQGMSVSHMKPFPTYYQPGWSLQVKSETVVQTLGHRVSAFNGKRKWRQRKQLNNYFEQFQVPFFESMCKNKYLTCGHWNI